MTFYQVFPRKCCTDGGTHRRRPGHVAAGILPAVEPRVPARRQDWRTQLGVEFLRCPARRRARGAIAGDGRK